MSAPHRHQQEPRRRQRCHLRQCQPQARRDASRRQHRCQQRGVVAQHSTADQNRQRLRRLAPHCHCHLHRHQCQLSCRNLRGQAASQSHVALLQGRQCQHRQQPHHRAVVGQRHAGTQPQQRHSLPAPPRVCCCVCLLRPVALARRCLSRAGRRQTTDTGRIESRIKSQSLCQMQIQSRMRPQRGKRCRRLHLGRCLRACLHQHFQAPCQLQKQAQQPLPARQRLAAPDLHQAAVARCETSAATATLRQASLAAAAPVPVRAPTVAH